MEGIELLLLYPDTKITIVFNSYSFLVNFLSKHFRWDNHNHHLTDLDTTDSSATMQKPNTTNAVNEQETIKEPAPKFPTISPSLLGFGGPNTSSRPTARTQGKFGISPYFFMSVIES